MRAIQQQLKRAGCCSGRVSGVWSPSTRKAMAAFADVVNASLPVNRADPVLLVLIESNPGASCTPDCAKDGGSACGQPARKPEVASLDENGAPGPDETSAEENPETTAEPTATMQSTLAAPAGPGARETSAARLAPQPETDVETAALPAPSALARNAEPDDRRDVRQASTRKYKKKSSFSREFNKSMKSLQRSLDKLF